MKEKEIEILAEKKREVLINFFKKADIKQFFNYNEETKLYEFSFTEKEVVCESKVQDYITRIELIKNQSNND